MSLAARASSEAAASARMEIYPRGMRASRTVKLSLNVLTPPGLTPEVVRQRVQGRYPQAQALAEVREYLDVLLDPHGLRFEPQSGEYLRPGLAHLTTGTIIAPTRLTSALPHQRRLRSPQAMEAQAFQDALDLGVESGRFRVVQVRADFAERASTLLAESLGVEPISLDHRVWDAMRASAQDLGVDQAAIVAADREGAGGEHWELLCELMEKAAMTVVHEILADRARTALLVHPGVLARFELSPVLFELSQRAQNEDGAAVVLLVPCHADGLAPSINKRLPVPTVAGSQRLHMPESWFRNAHRAPAVRGEA